MKVKTFKPKPGQVDYTNIRWAPVINCVLKYKNKVLLLQRSETLNFYPGFWNGVSGFLDDNKSLEEKVVEELKEELGLKKSEIKNMKSGEVFDQDEPKYTKTWIVHPVLVEVKTEKIKLDWESRNCKWVSFKEAVMMKLLPGFDKVLEKLYPLTKK